MSNLSKQFVFAVGLNSTDFSNVTIPNYTVAPDGGTTFYSKPEQGDGYFGAGDGIHTVTYTVSAQFAGSVSMQGTLAIAPANADWFNIYNTTSTYTTINTPSTSTNYTNFTGNFVWVRAKVDKTGGSVIAINYNH